jgi:LPS-assembly protein
LDYIKDKDYGAIKTVKIQELEVDRDEREAPTALPILSYYTERKPSKSWFNQTYSLLTNSTVITRRSGLQYRRLSLKPEIKIPYNLKGNLFELSSNIQSDFYNMEDNFIDSNRNNNFNSTATNYRPEVNFKWSLPMVTKHNSNTLVLEPLATLTASSYTNGNSNIPNEDSNNTELTQGNLFLSDRFTGFDRNESGQRMSYGFKSSLFNNYGQFNLGLGQSWRRTPITQDVILRGFSDSNKSNIVGELGYRASKIFNISYNFQLNESSYSNDINEVAAGLDFGRVRIGSNYILLKKTTTNLNEREQIDLSFSANITKELVFDTNTTHDLVTKRKIYSKYGLNYNGCCISYGFSYSENNPTALTQVERSYNINFAIKNL